MNYKADTVLAIHAGMLDMPIKKTNLQLSLEALLNEHSLCKSEGSTEDTVFKRYIHKRDGTEPTINQIRNHHKYRGTFHKEYKWNATVKIFRIPVGISDTDIDIYLGLCGIPQQAYKILNVANINKKKAHKKYTDIIDDLILEIRKIK